MDKSGAKKAAIDEINASLAVLIRSNTSTILLNTTIERSLDRAMPGLRSFRSACSMLVGIELMHMIRKSQFAIDSAATMVFAYQFYSLAGQVPHFEGLWCKPAAWLE